MQLLGLAIPYIFAVVAVIFAALGVVDAAFVNGSHQAFVQWTANLAGAYMWMGLSFGGVYIVFTVVQLAMLDLHRDKDYQLEEEKRRLLRLVLACFVLALPATAMYAVNARYIAQQYGSGFWSEGSIVYLVAFLFIACFLLLWLQGRERGWI